MSRKRATEYERMTSQLREEQTRYQQEAASRLQQLQVTLESAERQALAGLDDATLERLRADGDPEYGIQLAERMRREQALKEARAAAVTEAQRLQQEQQAQRAQALMAYREKAMQTLLDTQEFREWRDPSKYDAGSQRLSQHAQQVLGFTEQDLANLYDPRVVRMMEHSRLYTESQSKATAARKQVVKVGKKVAKPGASNTKARQRGSELETARKRLKSSGKVEDAVGLLQARRRNR